MITSYGIPLTPVTSSKYLGRVLSAADNDWPEVVHKLWRARQKWARLYLVLIREGADAQTLGRIYVVVVQAVVLYRSEKWVMTPHIGRFGDRLDQRVAHRLTGRQPRRGRDSGWVYPPLEEAMVEAGLKEVETYVSCRKKKVAQFIATRPIVDMCL